MTWATTHMLGELLKTGVRVHFYTGPFLHTKLLLVDDYYAQIGSSNLDPRSLRLNFEIAVEIYDHVFGRGVAVHFAEMLATSRELSFSTWQERSLPRRLRDAVFWVFSPYL
jgi:cardiolipin synthase